MVNEYTYLSLFAQAPGKMFSLQEFEEHHNRPHQTIKRYLDRLVRRGILREDKRKRFRFYTLDLQNPLTKDALSICEKLRLIERFQESYLLKQLYDDLSAYFAKNSFLVFGSAANDEEYNDIDLLCLGDGKGVQEATEAFEQAFGKKIHLIIAQERNLSETFLKELINKHLIFNDHDRFVQIIGKDSLVPAAGKGDTGATSKPLARTGLPGKRPRNA